MLAKASTQIFMHKASALAHVQHIKSPLALNGIKQDISSFGSETFELY